MILGFALCAGAGIRICDSCHRHVDQHQHVARNPNQPHIAASRSDRCHHWKAKPSSGAVTPTDRR